MYLTNTNLSDELIANLRISSKLKLLSLEGTRVTAEGMQRLGELPRWSTVYLSQEFVSAEDTKSLTLQFPYTDYIRGL